ncbi:MAG: DUF1385 domain-containing protein, partial [Armatimonadetes bacterium]|nr:DUF1385 domain-containing protein [Armatimonadota bacterium]
MLRMKQYRAGQSQQTGPVLSRHITRAVGVLSPEDSVGRASELMRASGCPALPVGENGHISGLVTEADLVRSWSMAPESDNGHEDSSHCARRVTVRDIMSPPVMPALADLPVTDLVGTFARTAVEALPVVEIDGSFLGMIRRADITSAMYRSLRPPTIGGMATPMGVFLTTGVVAAGANQYALMLTGAAMMLMSGATHAVLFALAFAVDQVLHTRWTDVVLSPDVTVLRGQTEMVVYYCMVTVEAVGWLLCLRLLPLAGYHAAEHQTVHAIERGLPLDLAVVRTMPRPHPRCGTNLAALVVLWFILTQWVPDYAAAVITFFTWRFLGMRLQYYFTTKPATDKQLLNGIAVGEELLAKYQDRIGQTVPIWRKIWNMGFPQV